MRTPDEIVFALALLAAAGCASSRAATSPPTSTSTSTPAQAPTATATATPTSTSTSTPTPDLSQLHHPCPEAGCPAGLRCLQWCGIAGCRPGLVQHTCEIPCKVDRQCPAGLHCATVADGPGRVCN